MIYNEIPLDSGILYKKCFGEGKSGDSRDEIKIHHYLRVIRFKEMWKKIRMYETYILFSD